MGSACAFTEPSSRFSHQVTFDCGANKKRQLCQVNRLLTHTWKVMRLFRNKVSIRFKIDVLKLSRIKSICCCIANPLIDLRKRIYYDLTCIKVQLIKGYAKQVGLYCKSNTTIFDNRIEEGWRYEQRLLLPIFLRLIVYIAYCLYCCCLYSSCDSILRPRERRIVTVDLSGMFS